MDALRDWLLSTASKDRTPADFVRELCEHLLQEGFPLWRCNTALLAFDPNLAGQQLIWVRGEPMKVVERPWTDLTSGPYGNSPVKVAIERGESTRCRLDGPPESIPYSELVDIGRRGGTDYLLVPLALEEALTPERTPGARRGIISWTSDDPAGFSHAQVEALRSLVPVLSLRMSLEITKASARQLLRAYLGQNAAQRVLEGNFKRGTAHAIDAVIWFCDMKGFTPLSDARPASEVVGILDRCFEALAQPVEEHGGEILKFIGDAVLAIFPIGEGGPREPARASLAAVKRARARLAALNAELRAADGTEVGFGIALHLGQVMYGNIGGRTRLDFTVIGAPVNEVCRVESLTRPLGHDVLLTAELVKAAELPEGAVSSLGHHALKGVGARREIFAPTAD